MPACSADLTDDTVPGMIAHQLALLQKKQGLLLSLSLSLSATASLARVRLHEQSEPYDSDVSCVSAPQ